MARCHAALLLTVVALVLAGCGGGDAPSEAAPPAPSPAGTNGTAPAPEAGSAQILVDVRTPEEYAEGHAPAALNIDVSAPDFEARVAELDPDGSYLVYCRSGNRSAQAAETMREAGLEVEDGGGLADMEAAGWTLDER